MNPVHDTIAYDFLGRKKEMEGGWKGRRDGGRKREKGRKPEKEEERGRGRKP